LPTSGTGTAISIKADQALSNSGRGFGGTFFALFAICLSPVTFPVQPPTASAFLLLAFAPPMPAASLAGQAILRILARGGYGAGARLAVIP